MSAPSKAEILEEYAGQLQFTMQDWAQLFAAYLQDENYAPELMAALYELGVVVQKTK